MSEYLEFLASKRPSAQAVGFDRVPELHRDLMPHQRDRFAMAALTGLLAAGDALAYNREEVAAETWKQADATLKAREENSQ